MLVDEEAARREYLILLGAKAEHEAAEKALEGYGVPTTFAFAREPLRLVRLPLVARIASLIAAVESARQAAVNEEERARRDADEARAELARVQEHRPVLRADAIRTVWADLVRNCDASSPAMPSLRRLGALLLPLGVEPQP